MQDSNEIVMIVPKLPPLIDGIGDYGLNLARQLYQDFGWKTHLIVGMPEYTGGIQEDCFRVSVVADRSHSALLKLLPAPPATVLLQYAGHGYAERGCPVWLVKALEQWCRRGGRLVTMFHELYATRPLFSSATLTRHLQKRLAVKLMNLSDRAFTNRQAYAARIRHLSRTQEVTVMPVFSNVGECQSPKPLSERSRRLVVFGSSGARQRLYEQPRLERLCNQLQIETIIDIGVPLKVQPAQLGTVPIQALGIQSDQQISQCLSDAIAGVVDYPADYLGKSGIFAAYCSHGVLPIVSSDRTEEQDGLQASQQYWLLQDAAHLLDSPQAIATAAYQWYQLHSLRTQAQHYAAVLQASKLSNSLSMPCL